MQETGVVLRLVDSVAEVQIKAKPACGKCNLCQPGGYGFMIIRASNPLGASPGDTVRIETSSGKLVVIASMIFILPLMALIIGLGLGEILSGKYDMVKGTTHLISLSCGLGFLGLSYLFIHFFDKRVSRKGDWRPRIVEIIKRAEPSHN